MNPANSQQPTAEVSRLTDEALDGAILQALYPDKRNSDVQLSVDIAGSGGAIRTTIRCFGLETLGLICCSYRVRQGDAAYWMLTGRGRIAVAQALGMSPTGNGGTL